MKRLQYKVNIVPVLAKADSLTKVSYEVSIKLSPIIIPNILSLRYPNKVSNILCQLFIPNTQ